MSLDIMALEREQDRGLLSRINQYKPPEQGSCMAKVFSVVGGIALLYATYKLVNTDLPESLTDYKIPEGN